MDSTKHLDHRQSGQQLLSGNSVDNALMDRKMNRSKSKIAVYYPAFLGGGAEAVGLWMLEALQHRHHLTLFTLTEIDFAKLNAMYGTHLLPDLSLTNSQTVAKYVQAEYGCGSTVVYPPVVLDSPTVGWEQKENAFICSGRLVEAKSPHRAIRILKQVRERGFDVKLHLTGGGGGVYAWKYQRFLKQMVRENADWVTLHQDLSYGEYVSVLAQCKYGLHYKQEPFGISIAEMVKAGAIPFVRREGGQVEIVGAQNPDLLFGNESEAVEQIVQVLQSPEKQAALQTALAEQRELFSTQRFMAEVNQAVDLYLQSQNVGRELNGQPISSSPISSSTVEGVCP